MNKNQIEISNVKKIKETEQNSNANPNSIKRNHDQKSNRN